jgi:glycosyltransferase involved in cell wall biosynthesis
MEIKPQETDKILNNRFVNFLVEKLKLGDRYCRVLFRNLMLRESKNQKTNLKYDFIILLHEMSNTGAPAVTISLANKIKEKGYSVIFFAIRKGELSPIFKSEFDVVYEDLNSLNNLFNTIDLKSIKQVIFSSIETLIYFDTFSNKGLDTRIWIHELPEHLETLPLSKINDIKRCLINNRILLGSNFQKNQFLENNLIRPDLADVFTNPSINITNKSKKNAMLVDNYFIFAGTFILRKGADLLPSILLNFFREETDSIIKDVKFYWLGDHVDGDLANRVKKDLRKMGLLEKIDFLQPVDVQDLDAFINDSMGLIIPSREDPLPNVSLMAVSNDVPVFSFRQATGISELSKFYEMNLFESPYLDCAALASDLKRRVDQLEKGFDKNSRSKVDFQEIDSKRDFMNPSWEDLFFKLDLNVNQELHESESTKQEYTVFLSSYNQSRFLSDALNSVKNQSILPKRIIFLDDASDDDSIVTAKKFQVFFENQGIEFQIVVRDHNSGNPFTNWEHAFQLSESEFIWILEGDDYADSRFAEKCMRVFQGNKVDICATKSQNIDEFGNFLKSSSTDHVLGLQDEIFDVSHTRPLLNTYNASFVFRNIFPSVSAVMFRTNYIKAIDLKSFRIAGDWFSYTNLYPSDAKYFYINEVLSFHRHHTRSQRQSLKYTELILPEIVRVQTNVFNQIKNDNNYNLYMNAILRTFIDSLNTIGIENSRLKDVHDLWISIMNIVPLELRKIFNYPVFFIDNATRDFEKENIDLVISLIRAKVVEDLIIIYVGHDSTLIYFSNTVGFEPMINYKANDRQLFALSKVWQGHVIYLTKESNIYDLENEILVDSEKYLIGANGVYQSLIYDESISLQSIKLTIEHKLGKG